MGDGTYDKPVSNMCDCKTRKAVNFCPAGAPPSPTPTPPKPANCPWDSVKKNPHG